VLIQEQFGAGARLGGYERFVYPLEVTGSRLATSDSGKKSSLHHPVAGVLAFAAWAFASGGPFMQFQWYDRTMGSIVLVLVCLCLPLIERVLPSKNENT
jgi:hypothetical protein